MNKVIDISYRGEQPGVSSEIGSLAVAQELPEQRRLSVADVAAIIDDMHGVVDPCQNTRDNNSYFALPEVGSNLKQHQQQYLLDKYSSTSSLENLASKFGGSCAVKQGKTIGFEIYAFWTNEEIADNYKLICPVGRLDNQRRVQSRFRLRIEVSNASAIDFSYYVLEQEGFPPFKNLEWISGNVVDQYGRAKSIADPKWDRGGRLYWSENIRSGHIFAEFDTIYDRWDCTLQGVWTDGKRDYNATVTAIWEGDPVSLPLDVPDAGSEESEPCREVLNDADAVDLSVPSNDPPETTGGSGTPEEPSGCYQVTITDYYHPCTGDYVRSDETQVPSPCDGFDDLDGPNPPVIYKEAFIGVGDPGFAGGTDCANGCTAAQYEEICCRTPDESFCVPTCLEWHSKNQGGLLPPGGMDALKQEYGDDFQLIWVYPDDGDCGEHVDKLVLPNKDCGCQYNESRLVVDFLLGNLEYKIDDGEWINIGGDRTIFYLPNESISLRLTKISEQTALDYKIYAGIELVFEDSYDETYNRLPCAQIDGQISPPTEWPVRELRYFGSRNEVDTWVLSFGYPSANEDMTDCDSPGWDGWQGLDTSYRGYYIRWGNDYGAGDIGLGERILGAWCKGVCPVIEDVVYEKTIEAVC